MTYAIKFITESLMIEGIHREPTDREIECHEWFMRLTVITVDDLKKFVSFYEPEAKLRDMPGMNRKVGDHSPPNGGPHVEYELWDILAALGTDTPFESHVRYETLHPFTDCNGRSGRALWAWQMSQWYDRECPSFLHQFYYQSLQAQVTKEMALDAGLY